MPTNTWQAYNFRDADGDGYGDSWYAGPQINSVVARRGPFLDRGVPPHFRPYDRRFLHWLARRGRQVDVLADERPRAARRAQLAPPYDLIVFPGHQEYVTSRDVRRDQALPRPGRQPRVPLGEQLLLPRRAARLATRPRRAAGATSAARRPALVGAQYVGWFHNRYPQRPYVVARTRPAPWLFRGTGLARRRPLRQLRHRDRRQHARARRRAHVLARIPRHLRPGPLGRDDLLRDAARREGLRGRRHQLRRLGAPIARATLLENLWRG